MHHFAGQITAAIQNNNGWGSNIVISDEESEVLETGGGLLKAAPYLQGEQPIVLMNVDILTDLDLHAMINRHVERSPLATLATRQRETSRYLLFNQKEELCGWRNVVTGEEKPANKSGERIATIQKAFSGIHVIDTKIFSLIKREGKVFDD